MLRLMTALDHVPVLLLGRRSEVLARNGLLTAVLGTPMAPGSSFVAVAVPRSGRTRPDR